MGHGGPLVEREAELAVLDESIRSTIAGQGVVVVVEGPAGIGKTSLLDEARRRAAAGGMTVVSGQGAVLEHDFGFGVVRQLFEPVVGGATAQVRQRLLQGAAGLAAPVVAPRGVAAGDELPSQQPAIVHGLYWLTANLAERTPVLLAVDDVHWSDESSLQFLAYLARRLEGMTVLMVVAVRTGDPQVEAAVVAELVSGPRVRVIRPAPLSVDGVGQVVRARLGAAEEPFVEACRTASGGVPFLVGELVGALHADGVQPTAEAAIQIARTGPRTVAHATMLRLSRLSPSAASVARAVAVLGRQARLDRIAALADVDADDTRVAIEALVGMEILAPGQPLRFVHPLVHQAIYDDMSPTASADAHGRAGRLLAGEHAPADEVAAHLLLSDPAGRADVVEMLQAAAGQVLARGAPGSAVAYLRRALAEGATADDRVALLYELGHAEALARDPRAAGDLEEAMRVSDDPVARARIAYELSEVHIFSGRWADRVALMSHALVELGDRDPDLAARIEAGRAATEFYDPQFESDFEARVPGLRTLVDRGKKGARSLALVLAALGTCRGMDRAEILALVEQGFDGGRFLQDEGAESLMMVQGVSALLCLDDLDAAAEATKDVIDDARRRGSVAGYAVGSYYRLRIDVQRGMLASAEVHLRSCVELALEHGLLFGLPSALHAGADALLERPQLEDVVALVTSLELEPALAATVSGAWVMDLRGRLALRRGEREAAAADLRASGETLAALRFRNPLAAPWRSPLALALPPEAAAEARALVEDELQDAAAFGLPRCQGVALRAAGCLEGGEQGIELLENSLVLLQHPDHSLERARTLVELGAARRRANQRVAAREPLAAGLDLAHRCGAERLAARAVEELQASGARPRRRVVSGPDALTSAEGRVARMAADGMANREIAQALFVTAKTVENQLSATYRKLGVRSRDQLRRALRTSEQSG